MTHNQTNHEAGADVLASLVSGGIMTRTYPRLTVRRNAGGMFYAYLVKSEGAREVYVSAGATAAEARAWLPERLEGA